MKVPPALALLCFAVPLGGSLRCQTPAAERPRRRVFLLAGQSNLAYLDLGPKGPAGLRRKNVTYLTLHQGAGPDAPRPLMEIGARLGDAHPKDHCYLLDFAVPGSALFRAFARLGRRPVPWWVGGGGSILERVRKALPWLPRLQPESLTILWSQGETDMLHGVGPATYRDGALLVFDAIRKHWFGLRKARVLLIPPGTIDSRHQVGRLAQGVRDAYVLLDGFSGAGLDVRLLCTHHDLPMTDAYHHSYQGYLEFARRIGDALTRGPLTLPRLAAFEAGAVRLRAPAGASFTGFGGIETLFFLDSDEGLIPCRPRLLGSDLLLLPHRPPPAKGHLVLRYLPGSGYPGLWRRRGLAQGGRMLPPFAIPVR